jgi:hypothetical protein
MQTKKKFRKGKDENTERNMQSSIEHLLAKQEIDIQSQLMVQFLSLSEIK